MIEKILMDNAGRLHLQGGPGYGDEQIIVESSPSNGLRIEILYEDEDSIAQYWVPFHIHSTETARLIAKRLLEFCEGPNSTTK